VIWGVEYSDSWGRQVNGQATVITEAFEAVMLLFLLVSFLSAPIPGLVQLLMGALDDAVGLLPDFAGAEVEADCLFQPEGADFLPWCSSSKCHISRCWP